eukprot:SM000307S11684  [mRNA]  locus=s307:12735:17907:+ [translate_table: standard]
MSRRRKAAAAVAQAEEAQPEDGVLATTPVFLYDSLEPLLAEEGLDAAATSGLGSDEVLRDPSELAVTRVRVTGEQAAVVGAAADIIDSALPDAREGAADFLSLELEGIAGVPAGAGAPIVSSKEDGEVPSLKEDRKKPSSRQASVSELQNGSLHVTPPWARHQQKRALHSPYLRLHQGSVNKEPTDLLTPMLVYAEILDFCRFVAPTKEEVESREAAVRRVTAVIKSIWPKCQVKMFGSFATNLYLPTSDCDMVVLNAKCSSPQQGLRALSNALMRQSMAKRMQVIAKARVPIIKFIEKESQIHFDVSFDVANGPDAASFIKEALADMPPLKPLSLVIKIFLQQRELNEVYSGGLGSYALLVMLMAHLQLHPSRRSSDDLSPARPLENNLGMLLVDFFELYGRNLNYRDVGVSCATGGSFFSKHLRELADDNRPYLLSVEDPQNTSNDIGKNSYNVGKVRTAFLNAHSLLTNLDADYAPKGVGLLGRIVRMDDILAHRPMPAGLSSPFSNFHRLPSPTPGSAGPLSVIHDSWQEADFPRGGADQEGAVGRRQLKKRRWEEIQRSREEHHLAGPSRSEKLDTTDEEDLHFTRQELEVAVSRSGNRRERRELERREKVMLREASSSKRHRRQRERDPADSDEDHGHHRHRSHHHHHHEKRRRYHHS